MKKESRRVKMTKNLLCESIMHFLSQKDLKHITVKEICDYADINRSTYYRYYQDPTDQLNKIEEELLLEFDTYIDNLIQNISKISNNSSTAYYAAMVEYLTCAQKKKDMIQILIDVFPDNRFLTNFAGRIQSRLRTLFSALNDDISICDYVFVSSGCIGLLIHWLTVNPQMSVQTVAQLMVSYTSPFSSPV